MSNFLLAALRANVNNDSISDAEFREFVRRNLPKKCAYLICKQAPQTESAYCSQTCLEQHKRWLKKFKPQEAYAHEASALQ